GGVVTWSAAELLAGAEGSVTLTVLVDTPLDNGTTISNSATLESDQTAPVSTSHELAVQSTPVLTLTKTADKAVVSPGDTITYTLSFANAGNANASGGVLKDTIPTNTTFVSATGGGTEAGGIVSWPLGTINAGTNGSVAMTVMVDTPLNNGTLIYNSTTLGSDQSVPVSASHKLSVQSTPLLNLEKTADTQFASPGDLISYSITLSNTGTADATNAILRDQLPVDTTFVDATGGGTELGGIISWPPAPLAVGATSTVLVTVTVNTPLDDATLLHNVVGLTANDATSVTAYADVVVQSAPTPELIKTADVSFVQKGEKITYAIGYGNNGTPAC
ncbi:MAG: hypothetical protein DRQ44_11225, partial [Gammaproteobacteria bacterium]